MSVRRLAEPAVQPASFAFNKANAAWAKQTIKKYPAGRQQSAVIPLLMRAQEQEGWVTQAAIEHVGTMLDMPLIRVLEVATFYTQFQLKPVGTRAHVQVCGTTPCMLRGSEELMNVCRSKIHPDQFHTNAEGTLSWEEVECLGACVNAPMVMIFKDTYEDLTPERLAEIIDAFDAGKAAEVTPGPQIDRIFSAPESGLTALVDEQAVLKEARDREAKPAARATGDGADLGPSRAAKPKTDAPETNPAIKSPSPQKVDPAVEKSASTQAPRTSKASADRAEPAVEKNARRRVHPDGNQGDQSKEAPELLHGEPVGPAGKRRASEAAAPVGDASPETGASRSGANTDLPSLQSEDRPQGITQPDKLDDLQLISGVGPRIEETLHALGIYTYAQIAAWNERERAWVDGYLRFRGRIERENWVAQADALAKGGEAEYIRVFGKKPR